MASSVKGTILNWNEEEDREDFQEEGVFRLYPERRVGVTQGRRKENALARETSSFQRSQEGRI